MWLLSEARITVGAPTQSAAETRTLVPYAVARVTTALTAAYSAPAVPDKFGSVLAGVFVAGVTLRAWAIHEFGVQYSHRVVRISEGGLISSGPYRVLRHPAYAGMLLANIGFVGYFSSPASIAALALLIAAILWRIRVEEDILVRVTRISRFASSDADCAGGVVMIKIVDAPAELADASLVGTSSRASNGYAMPGFPGPTVLLHRHRVSMDSHRRCGGPFPGVDAGVERLTTWAETARSAAERMCLSAGNRSRILKNTLGLGSHDVAVRACVVGRNGTAGRRRRRRPVCGAHR